MKQIPDFSNYGVTKKGEVYSYRNKLYLNPSILGKYHSVVITRDDGKRMSFRVHRLVAFVFIPNPHNYPIVNHIDGDPFNNNVENLEWCDYKHNSLHAHKNGLIKSYTRRIKALNSDGSLYKFYSTAEESFFHQYSCC